MSAYRSMGQSAGIPRLNGPGDTEIVPIDTSQSVAITGGVTLTARNLLSGVCFFTGTGGVTVTLPSATDIYNALVGEGSDPDLVAGMGFIVDFVNNSDGTATFADSADGSTDISTFALATLVSGRVAFKFAAVQKPVSVVVQTASSDDDVTLVFNNAAQTGAPIGPAYNAVNLTPGAWIGKITTTLANGASILSVASGPAGVTGFKMSANAGATAVKVGMNIGPAITVTPLYKMSPS